MDSKDCPQQPPPETPAKKSAADDDDDDDKSDKADDALTPEELVSVASGSIEKKQQQQQQQPAILEGSGTTSDNMEMKQQNNAKEKDVVGVAPPPVLARGQDILHTTPGAFRSGGDDTSAALRNSSINTQNMTALVNEEEETATAEPVEATLVTPSDDRAAAAETQQAVEGEEVYQAEPLDEQAAVLKATEQSSQRPMIRKWVWIAVVVIVSLAVIAVAVAVSVIVVSNNNKNQKKKKNYGNDPTNSATTNTAASTAAPTVSPATRFQDVNRVTYHAAALTALMPSSCRLETSLPSDNNGTTGGATVLLQCGGDDSDEAAAIALLGSPNENDRSFICNATSKAVLHCHIPENNGLVQQAGFLFACGSSSNSNTIATVQIHETRAVCQQRRNTRTRVLQGQQQQQRQQGGAPLLAALGLSRYCGGQRRNKNRPENNATTSAFRPVLAPSCGGSGSQNAAVSTSTSSTGDGDENDDDRMQSYCFTHHVVCPRCDGELSLDVSVSDEDTGVNKDPWITVGEAEAYASAGESCEFSEYDASSREALQSFPEKILGEQRRFFEDWIREQFPDSTDSEDDDPEDW